MLRYKQRYIARLLQQTSARGYSKSSTGGGGDDNKSDYDENHPIRRTLRLLGNDMRKVKEFFVPKDPIPEDVSERSVLQSKFNFKGVQSTSDDFQTHCDVLVIGGGGVGSSIAYWLKERAREGLNVVVVEKDNTYAKSATRLSVCGLHQQFSLPENIQMSLFAADFLRDSKNHFGPDIPLNYTPHGHLVLASEEGAETLKHNSLVQNELGARNELVTHDRLATRFPWLNTSGVALACQSLEREGWFDPWALLMGFRLGAVGRGAHYVDGELVEFLFQNQPDITIAGDMTSSAGTYESLDKAVVQMADGTRRSIKFGLCVIAAGGNSAQVAHMARIGCGPGMLGMPLPLVLRKRQVYTISSEAPNDPGMRAPQTVDANGTFFRRDGLTGNYICGRSVPNETEDDVSADDVQADPAYFESEIKPTLAKRVPAFAAAEVVDSWAGTYESNVYDDSGIVGPHPYYNNLYIATGFSAQGIQQAPAVGRAISELIMDGQFRTIDLSRLSFDRFIVDRPMHERNIV